MNLGAEGMRIHEPRRLPLNLLAASLLLACAPFARAGDAEGAGDPAQDATPAQAAGPQQAQTLPEPQMAAQTQASFVLQGVQFDGATGEHILWPADEHDRRRSGAVPGGVRGSLHSHAPSLPCPWDTASRSPARQ